MKRSFLFLMCIIPLFLFAQVKHNTYVDALELASVYKQFAENPNGLTLVAYYDLLKKYGIEKTEMNSNPFLATLVIEPPPAANVPDGNGGKTTSHEGVTLLKNAAATFSSTNWQSMVISTVSNFMAGRFKQESMHMGINFVFKNIKEGETRELVTTFFPKTFKNIEQLYGDGGNSYYTADLLYLRQVIHSDYADLPSTLITNANLIFPQLDTKPEIKDLMKAGYKMYHYGRQGYSIPDIISGLAAETYTNEKIGKAFQIADVVSAAFLDTLNAETVWVNPLRLLPGRVQDTRTPEVRFFYGLLYEQLKADNTLKMLLQPYENNIVKLSEQINKLFGFIAQLNNTYIFLKAKSFQLSNVDDKVLFLKELQQGLELFITNQIMREYLNLSYSYSGVFLKYMDIAEAVLNKDFEKAIPLVTIHLGEYMDKKYSRSLTFVSQLATIENADDMEKLLSAYSLPIGSASIKRRSSSNWSLNGYVGFTAGNERALGEVKQNKANVGLTAPIGIAYTFDLPKCKNTITVLGSIVDLGSMVNTRLDNDTTSYGNLRFEHFLSPGIGVYYNWKNAPITMGASFYYIPSLRTIKYEKQGATITETNTSVTRLNVSIMVDIPFLTLYNKPR